MEYKAALEKIVRLCDDAEMIASISGSRHWNLTGFEKVLHNIARKALGSMDIGVIGLGKLGLPLAALYAKNGHKVYGYDKDIKIVEAVNKKISPYPEPYLQDLLVEAKSNLIAYLPYEMAEHLDMFFVVVPTPSWRDGAFSNRYIIDTFTKLGPYLKKNERKPIIVICSTVMPGSIRELADILEEETGGKDIGLCYSPEFIALGDVISGLSNPDFILIGSEDEEVANAVEYTIKTIVKNDAPVKRMSPIEAEITKISINTYLTMKISYANMIGQICKAKGVSPNGVLEAVGSDHRIGNKFLRSGMPYGGPCLARDVRAFGVVCQESGVQEDLLDAIWTINDSVRENIVDRMESAGGPYLISGISYKHSAPNIFDDSIGYDILEYLVDIEENVCVYDHPVTIEALGKMGYEPDVLLPYNKIIDFSEFKTIVILDVEEKKRKFLEDNGKRYNLNIIHCWDDND